MNITDILYNLKDYTDSSYFFGKKIKLLNKKLTTDAVINIQGVSALTNLNPFVASDHNINLKNLMIIGKHGSNYLIASETHYADNTDPILELFLTPVSNVTFVEG